MTSKIPLSTLNAMDAGDFSRALGAVFEHSPWVAERVHAHRPFTSVDALHRAMVNLVARASAADRLALLCAHPELAGREARQGALTAASAGEQSGAGLNALTREEMAQVTQLNADYRSRFGFPFIIAVRNYSKADIFREWQARLENDRDREIENCLKQVNDIARLRLETLIDAHT